MPSELANGKVSGLTGTFEREYGRARKFFAALVVGSGLTLALAAVLAALMLFALPSGANGDNLAVYVLIALCLTLCLFFVWRYLRERGVRVRIYADEIVYSRAGREQVFRWDEIACLYVDVRSNFINGVPLGKTYRYTLGKTNGEQLVLTHAIENIEQIGARLEEETFRRKFPRYLADLTGDYYETYDSFVSFDKFLLWRDSLMHHGERIALAEISDVKVVDGWIEIRRQGSSKAWATARYADIPDAHVFLPLVERLRNQ